MDNIVALAFKALDYRTPKKPCESEKMWQCPSCHRNLTDKRCIKKMYAYCPKCGQALDWNGITEIKVDLPNNNIFEITMNNSFTKYIKDGNIVYVMNTN